MESSQDIPKSELAADRLKVSDVVRNHKPVKVQGRYSFDDLQTEGEIVVDWRAQPETAGLSIHGTLAGTLKLECVRCLEPYMVPVNLKIDENYVFDRYVDPFEKEKELQAEDFFEVVSEEGELDLKDLAHQFLLLESENHPVCGRQECRFA